MPRGEYGQVIGGPSSIRLKVETDNVVGDLAQTLGVGYYPSIKFATQIASREIPQKYFPQVVYAMAGLAGEGFPESYTNHLAREIRNVFITLFDSGIGISAVTVNLSNLGGWDDLMLGAHQNALLNDGMDYDDFKSFRFSTKSQLPKNPLPNTASESDLFKRQGGNDRETRMDWWNRAIVRQEDTTAWVGKNWAWTKIQSTELAWEVPNVPTFEKVASDRVNRAWVPNRIAPEWLILQYGTPAGSEPSVTPRDFLGALERVGNCVFQKIVRSTVEEMERRVLDDNIRLRLQQVGPKSTGIEHDIRKKGVRLGPIDVTTGRYLPYKEASVPDCSECLALI